VAPQALTLFNGDFVNRQAEELAQRLVREAGREGERQIELAFRLTLTRSSTNEEKSALLQFLKGESDTTDKQNALAQVCRVLLNLNEFVYPN
jgi:hypothetical protein